MTQHTLKKSANASLRTGMYLSLKRHKNMCYQVVWEDFNFSFLTGIIQIIHLAVNPWTLHEECNNCTYKMDKTAFILRILSTSVKESNKWHATYRACCSVTQKSTFQVHEGLAFFVSTTEVEVRYQRTWQGWVTAAEQLAKVQKYVRNGQQNKRGCRQVLDPNDRGETSGDVGRQLPQNQASTDTLVLSPEGSIYLPFSLVLVILRICTRLSTHTDHRGREQKLSTTVQQPNTVQSCQGHCWAHPKYENPRGWCHSAL